MAVLKYSRQREAIKNFLMTRTDHPSADMVYENIRTVYPNISLGTVYRNLSLLADLGEIQKLPNSDGADRFDGRTDSHCHFFCTECGSVTDFDNDELVHAMEHVTKDFGGEIQHITAQFSGICECCKNKEKVISHS